MEGLAASMAPAQPQGPASPGNRGGQQMPTVEEVIALLMEGVPPEKLEEMGVPPEVILKAIQVIEQQMAQQGQAQAPQQGGGLAQQMAGA